MTRELLTRLPLWNDPTPAADAAVGALLDELVAGHGRVLHGETGAGRGRHVMISDRGVDIVRVVSMPGPLTAGRDGIGLVSAGDDVTSVLQWVDDLAAAMRESFGGGDAAHDSELDESSRVRGWLCVLDAAWTGGHDDLVVGGHRVVRYGALAHHLTRR